MNCERGWSTQAWEDSGQLVKTTYQKEISIPLSIDEEMPAYRAGQPGLLSSFRRLSNTDWFQQPFASQNLWPDQPWGYPGICWFAGGPILLSVSFQHSNYICQWGTRSTNARVLTGDEQGIDDSKCTDDPAQSYSWEKDDSNWDWIQTCCLLMSAGERSYWATNCLYSKGSAQQSLTT